MHRPAGQGTTESDLRARTRLGPRPYPASVSVRVYVRVEAGGGVTTSATARGGVLRVLAQAGGDLVDACPAEEADGDIVEEGHHRGPLPAVQGALVLTERDILDAMQAVLDRRVPACGCAALGRKQAFGRPRGRLVIPLCSACVVIPCSRQVRSRQRAGRPPCVQIAAGIAVTNRRSRRRVLQAGAPPARRPTAHRPPTGPGAAVATCSRSGPHIALRCTPGRAPIAAPLRHHPRRSGSGHRFVAAPP